MDSQQLLKAQTFKALHERDGAFVMPNPWDAGSAKLLASMGFEALATTSAGLAFTLGRPDAEGAISRDDTLANVADIVAATSLPVAADLENCFSDNPEGCAQTLLKAAAAGIVGGSIEDASGRADHPIYDFDLAVERVRASVAAVRSLPFPFMLTARAENLLNGRMDFADTLRRLEAYAEAGADVLYAPGLRTREEVIAVVRAVAPKPVNILMGLGGVTLSVADLSECGVKRISVGSSLARAAFGGLYRAAEEIRNYGTFNYAGQALPFDQLNDLFKG
ncbi:isocitrate lyase/PEP mutase family protein [Pseudomonas viridiflava]|uniref:Isocitrate lyase/phosphoenolpyruvate mutase family protein n=1 Tax=Pseudomonas viridiflava TaxID=33069 RepID=A0ABU7N125_PSEVI|nr:isocitrate lyase/phosphoenolpyruvate mutase family protein [Pseudomonas viridiflava]MBI6681576.1 isocitrate lyase/phosphoenolpyruvate mutase family protein [Pseudomonas viridiflava]MBI6704217.1 isocitrate lyase/phosphoenolpyruvate mutase family protein [Pseudomonas viridiflava]MBI6722843.1 isocitrate lyase/phosphoenolpyruvate mutase family protein [Pseudomonas viridiflava]MCJ8176533.1 isocitrate lyase/phosphoenolpyruvate mutase family protein [Pseudomonas viridiflava]MDY0916319.1 isocitrate